MDSSQRNVFIFDFVVDKFYSSSKAYLIVAERAGAFDKTISKKSVTGENEQKTKQKADKNKQTTKGSIHVTTMVYPLGYL